MNVHDIVKVWLSEHGYNGLCHWECGCELDDLMPCDGVMNGGSQSRCEPGYKVPCDCGEGCRWHIVTERVVKEAEDG